MFSRAITRAVRSARVRTFSTATRGAAATVNPVYLSPEKPREVAPAPIYRSSLASDAYTHLRERSYLTQKFDYFPRTDIHKKVVYEVTLEIDEDIVDDYLEWIRSGHIQEALALPGFVSWNILEAEGEAKTQGADGRKRRVFVENYVMENRDVLDDYFNKYAAPIRHDHTRMWDGKFAASRRILTLFGKQDESETQLWKDREARNEFRLNNLKNQVATVPFFNEIGFRVQKTPPALWEKIQAFYRANAHTAAEEKLNPIEVSINTWAAPTYKLDYPEDLTEEILATIKPILEEWSGIPELEPQGLSGIRFYQPGATIAEHVDMANSNVISALINIDQQVDEPWPFEMRDHSGQMHVMDMQPGDIIIYESATCAHRRSKPLKGNYFANTFMRFRPKGWTYEY